MPPCLPSRSKTAHFSTDVVSPQNYKMARQKSVKSNLSDCETSPVAKCSYSFFFRKNSRKHSRLSRKGSRKNSGLVVRTCKGKDGKETISQQSTVVTVISDSYTHPSRDTSLVSYPSFVTCLDEDEHTDSYTHAHREYMTAVNCVPMEEDLDEDEDNDIQKQDIDVDCGSDTTQFKTDIQPCVCAFQGHYLKFDANFPLITNPDIPIGGHEEHVCIASAMKGHWVTVLERSDSMDTQFKMMGINYIKRSVMNKLAVPLTLRLEKNDTVLHVYVHTPLGVRHMESNLCGQPFHDDDVDCGRWEGEMCVVDYTIDWFCKDKPVRALRQVRVNKKINATQIETRCVLPDTTDGGKMMLFNFKMYHNSDKDKIYNADRILKYISDGSEQKLK